MAGDDDPPGAGTRVEFGRLDEANAWRDEHPDALHPDDTRRTKTLLLHPDTASETVEDAEQAALISKGDETKSYQQETLTDAEKRKLERSTSFEWNQHGMGAMAAKGALTAEGVPSGDWLNFYEPGEGQAGALKNLEQSKQRAAATGAASGTSGDVLDSDTTDAERGRKTDRAQGEMCDHAADGCRHGEKEACEALREDCGLSEDRVADLFAVDVDGEPAEIVGDPPGGAPDDFDSLDGPMKGALARAWKGYEVAVRRLSEDLDDVDEQLGHAEQAVDSINAVEQAAGLEQTDEFRALRSHHETLADLAEQHAGAVHGQPDATTADAGDEPRGTTGETTDAAPSEPPEPEEPAPRQVTYADLPSGFPATMGPWHLTWATMRGDEVERVRYTTVSRHIPQNGIQLTHHPDRGEWVVCRWRDGWTEVETYDNSNGAVGKASHIARQRGSLPKVTQAVAEALADDSLRDRASATVDADAEPFGRWELGISGEHRTTYVLPRDDGKRLRVYAYHDDSRRNRPEGVVRLSMGRRPSDDGYGYESKQTLRIAEIPRDVRDDLSPEELRKLTRDAALTWMDEFPQGPPADVFDGWHGPAEFHSGLLRDEQGPKRSTERLTREMDEMLEGTRDPITGEKVEADPDLAGPEQVADEPAIPRDLSDDVHDDPPGDASGSGEQFASEKQGTLGVGVDPSDVYEDKQVTLTGDDTGAGSAALPADWRPAGPGEYRAGPFNVNAESDPGSRGGYAVILRGPDNVETLASGLPDRETAEAVAGEFTDRVAPDEVSFHSSDSAVPEAAAAAKKAALDGAEAGGLGAYSGPPGGYGEGN